MQSKCECLRILDQAALARSPRAFGLCKGSRFASLRHMPSLARVVRIGGSSGLVDVTAPYQTLTLPAHARIYGGASCGLEHAVAAATTITMTTHFVRQVFLIVGSSVASGSTANCTWR
jgi:hypothetical protein